MKRYALASLLLSGIVSAAPLVPSRTPPAPRFDRLYPNEQILDFLEAYAAAYPKFFKLESIGKTVGGNDTWLVTIRNPATGAELAKPAIYIDGATHANEVQGTETVLYFIDYLLKQYGRLPKITKLLDRAVFYIVPMVNPDNRGAWFKKPATPHFPRTLLVPIDDDRDGLADEDGSFVWAHF